MRKPISIRQYQSLRKSNDPKASREGLRRWPDNALMVERFLATKA
ncbi:hypothetical protein [Arsenophonus endosymbiont of Aleurodicus floccissimus]|nr:hypothetical protein [Arsenophonus endosymbiont of Aleurodicus floccissimus]